MNNKLKVSKKPAPEFRNIEGVIATVRSQLVMTGTTEDDLKRFDAYADEKLTQSKKEEES